MVIREINITEFGGLKGVSMSLSDGINLICGDNEAGKSTVMLFIKYMFYGLPRKSASNPERDRYISRDGKTAAGSMTFEANGKRYAVERHFRGVRGNDSFKLVCLDSGEEIVTEKQPGEYFFGVPREVFESSAAIGQMKASEINGERTVSAIENMLVSADESVDTAKVIASLDKIRTEYRHKNGSGGKLYHAELEIAEQREKVRVAAERAAALKEQKRKFAETEAELVRCEEEYNRIDAIYEKARNISLIKQFDKLHEAEQNLCAAEQEEKEFSDNAGRFSPTRASAERLKALMNEYGSAIRETELAQRSLEEAQNMGGDEKTAEEGKRYLSLGGKANLLTKAREIGQKASKMFACSVAAFSLAGISVLAYITLLMMHINIPYILIAPAVFAVIGIMSIKGSKSNSKKFAEALEGYESIQAYEARISSCEEHLRLWEAKTAAILKCEGRLEGAKKRVSDVSLIILRELESMGEDSDANELEANALRLISRIENHCSKAEDISSRKKAMQETVRMLKEPLAEYDEKTLRENVGDDFDSADTQSMEDVTVKRRFFSLKLDALRQTVRNMSSAVAQSEANFIDPLELADTLSELERKRGEDRDFYEALILAMDSLKTAGEKLQNSITPEIGRRAGDMMSIVSAGRYGSVITGKKLTPYITEKDMPISAELLSGGTRDALYTVLRISLMIQIFGNELPPILMDESLCQLDDTRAERMLSILGGLGKTGIQILLFSCHTREKEICSKSEIDNNFIAL